MACGHCSLPILWLTNPGSLYVFIYAFALAFSPNPDYLSWVLQASKPGSSLNLSTPCVFLRPHSDGIMIIKTKKYALDQKTYISLAMRQWLRDNWKWGFVPLGLIILNVILNLTNAYPNYWLYIVIVLLTILYVLFWGIQFTGVTQSEQFKPMFQKYVYEPSDSHAY